jgi:hypothetical protein
MTVSKEQTASNLRNVSYTMFFGGLVVGLAVAPFNPRLSLLPTALVFGWFQIGSG